MAESGADATSGIGVGADTSTPLLSGKVAIVTGGASAIGRACANRLAADGAKVVIADVHDAAGTEAARAIADSGGQALFLHTSSAERLDIHNLIATTIEAYSFVDILVCAASADEETTFLELGEEQFDRSIRAKLKGTFLSAQAVAKQFIKQIEEGRAPGVIITTGAVGMPNSEGSVAGAAASAASSGGVVHLTEAMAAALAPHGIRVNTIGPLTENDTEAEVPKSDEDAAEVSPAEQDARWAAYLQEVAALTAWLVSDRASHVSGETVYVGDRRVLATEAS
ncbi:MAG: SDR family oxidoreductase [Pseudomonadota bacterium]